MSTLAPPAPTGALTVPIRLPARLDGRSINHLSASSYGAWTRCPEQWRRRYIAGERTPPVGAMFLGSRVDDTLTGFYERQLAGEDLDTAQVLDLYRDIWTGCDEDCVWEADLAQDRAEKIGRAAVEAYMTQVAPTMGRAVATQRKVNFALSDSAEWDIVGYLDLEAVVANEHGEARKIAADYKVKGRAITDKAAALDAQASTYLHARSVEGDPADEFRFVTIVKPRANAAPEHVSITVATAVPSPLRARRALVRYAQMARAVCASYDAFGPEGPWDFAPAENEFPCSQRFCDWWETCPGGGGLA